MCVGAPGLDGAPGPQGQKGEPGDVGKSLVCGYPFLDTGLIMSSLLNLTYNVVKLPTHVCVLVSEVL